MQNSRNNHFPKRTLCISLLFGLRVSFFLQGYWKIWISAGRKLSRIERAYLLSSFLWDVNPVQDVRGQKDFSTSFSPATSTNIGIWSQIFLTFSFDPFATLVWNFKLIPGANLKLLNLKQEHPSKKIDFSGQTLMKLSVW